MKVGDLVRLKNAPNKVGVGIVLSKQMSGKPAHPCLTVYYAKAGRTWDIAESYMEVVSETVDG